LARRPRRIRRWLRIGALVSLIGIMRVARTARNRWQPLFRVLGTLLLALGVVFGVMTPVTFVSGMLILALSGSDRLLRSPEAAIVRLSARPTHDR